jgi:hypothetical protein
VLTRILNPGAMNRILDAPEKTESGDVFRLAELFDGLHTAVWEEVRRGAEPTPARRGLQKEHLRQLTSLVLKGNSVVPDDARALAREDLRILQGQLRAASRHKGLSRETRAHFAECQASIEETLKAPLQRTGM